MAALLDLSPALSFLSAANAVLYACGGVLLIMYVVRLVAWIRAGSNAPISEGHINTKLVTVIAVVLGTGWLSLSGLGMFTDSPLLGELGSLFRALLGIFVLVVALRWVRYG